MQLLQEQMESLELLEALRNSQTLEVYQRIGTEK